MRSPSGPDTGSRSVAALQQIALLLAILLAWYFASGNLLPAFYISDPVSVAKVIGRWIADGSLWLHIGTSMLTLFLGYAIGATLGIAFGLLLGMKPDLEEMLAPFIAAIYGLPKVALLPLFVIAFGIGLLSKVMLVASVVVFLLFYATLSGVRDIDRDMIDGLRLMGAKEDEITRKVRFPAILPWIYTGLRTSIGYALTTTVVAEALSSNRGLGFLIEHSAAQFNAAGVFAAVVVLLVVSSLIMIPLGMLEKRAGSR
ncbi:MAG TPA: ABC transporter permease [Rhizobiaceae bacterium]|nr:ABC transporter permease [Rhizobiaceae bacterium]